MQKIKLDKRTITFVAISIFLMVELLFLLPLSFKKIGYFNKQIKKVKEQLRIVEEDWPRKDEYLDKKKQLEIETAKLKTKFIGPNQESKLLTFMSLASKDFEVRIEDFLPQRLIQLASTDFGNFKYLPISVTAKSKFHNLAMFLDYLQNGPYFFDIKEIKIVSKYPNHSVGMLICGIIQQE